MDDKAKEADTAQAQATSADQKQVKIKIYQATDKENLT